MFGHESKLPSFTQQDVMATLNLDESNVWFQACEQITLFRCVMPVIMENLEIVQCHWNTLQHVIINEGGYQPEIFMFKLIDYVYLWRQH